MMTIQKHAFHSLLMAGTLAATAAVAQQPPDLVHSDDYDNTAAGTGALLSVQPPSGGTNNSAFGFGALQADTTGYNNNAFGWDALTSNTTGIHNNAFGFNALQTNSTGYDNSAFGHAALFANTMGYQNTAVGRDALWSNTTGYQNTAAGAYALYSNTTGNTNGALGANALYANTTGGNNTAFGANALAANTTGKGNAAQGVNALYSNSSGIRNLGIGNNALFANTTGSYNIGLGFEGGYNITTGSNNIEIGSAGTAGDDGTIQIGVQGTQMRTTIAGIFGTQLTGSAVYVTASGQLGVQASAERFKTDIAAMPDLSDSLQKLRPVTFHYKSDPHGERQYGLIAEEVAQIYPELVIRDGSGKIMGVHYEELAPMLLGQMQQERKARVQREASQAAQIRELENLVAAQGAMLQSTRRGLALLKKSDRELRAALAEYRRPQATLAQR